MDAPTADGIDASPSMELSATTLIVPELVSAKLAGKRFAVIGCETAEAVRVVAAFTAANASAWVVTIPPDGPSPNFFTSYDGCILRGIPTDGWGYVSAAELAAQCGKPALVIGSRDELAGLVGGAAAMVHDFLIDPWNAHDLLLRSFRQIVRIAANANGAEAGKATCRVLVADDDATIRMMVTGILGGSEIHCEVACDGYEALELARTFSPHVAILDINMPRMDGFEVLSAIKGDAFTRDVRVVMLSARQRETDVVRGFALGADDYVTKPFSSMELVARVRRALRPAL
ncbi:MAG TPA: response regulator [Candidatus Binataceae bacterium]|jgi:CheY-like chemotaxis protein